MRCLEAVFVVQKSIFSVEGVLSMSRHQSRGAVAVWAIVALVVLGLLGGGYWFFSKGSGFIDAGGSAFDLAKHLPAESRAAMMFKLSGQLDPSAIERDVEEILSKLPEEERDKLSTQIQEDFGAPLSELVKFFDGRAAFAVLDGAEPSTVGLIGLRDADGFAAYRKSSEAEAGKTETVESVVFRIDEQGVYHGHDSEWIYIASSPESAGVIVRSAAAAQGLDQVPSFLEAKEKVKGDRSLAGLYLDIAGLVKTLAEVKPPGTDEGTFTGLACLGYMVGSYDFKERESRGFLKVTQDDSQLAQKLLTKGGVNRATLEGIGKDLSFSQALDAEWTFNTVVALMTLSPETRQQAAMASMGLLAVGNPWTAFEGEFAFGSNVVEKSASTFTSSFGQARGRGQTTACGANLRNIGTALEMYSTDWSGRYPAKVEQITPNYLKTVPTCPSAGSDTYSRSYQQHEGDDFTLACQGNHHGAENLPSYTASAGLTMPQVEDPQEAEPSEPSFVVVAPVKDLNLAHNLLAKGLPDVGDEPKVGEEKVYPIPGGELKMKTEPPARLSFTFGPAGEAMANISEGSLADVAEMKRILEWGSDGLVQVDFLDLGPLLETVKKAVPEGEAESEAFLTALDKLQGFGLRGASGIAVRADGLEYRSYGVGAGPVVGVAAAILVPNFVRARAGGQLTACKSNLKNIGTACEMWSTDNAGKYPPNIGVLSPNYLRAIPQCPAAERDTYSASYALRKGSGGFEIYEIYCSGANHTSVSVPSDYPRYNGEVGLIEGP